MLSATLLNMTVPNSSSMPKSGLFMVRNDTQAKLLENPVSVNTMLPFWQSESSIAEAARELGQSINSVHYRVGRLLDAGLLVVSRTLPRAGRPIKFYRTAAGSFLIPDRFRQSAADETLLAELGPTLVKLARGQNQADDKTVGRCLRLDQDCRLVSERYRTAPDGKISLGRGENADQVKSVQYGSILLSADDAALFESQLKALIDRFTRHESLRPDRGMKEYVFIAALARTA